MSFKNKNQYVDRLYRHCITHLETKIINYNFKTYNSKLKLTNKLIQLIRDLDPLNKWSRVRSLTFAYRENSNGMWESICMPHKFFDGD